MEYDQFFQSVLKPLPCPVSKPPAGGNHETYVVFNEVLGTYAGHSSNEPNRLHHMVQVHAFSKCDDGTHLAIFRQAIKLLRASGVRVYSYGPDQYEKETTYHHIAATCEWAERLT